jgi:hypothetical protein
MACESRAYAGPGRGGVDTTNAPAASGLPRRRPESAASRDDPNLSTSTYEALDRRRKDRNVRPGERSDMWPGTAASPEQSRIKGGATGQRSRRAAGKDLPLRTTPELPPSATRPARVVSDVIGLDALAGHLLATSRLFDGLPLVSLGVSRRGSRSLLVPQHQAMVAVGTMSQLVPKTRHREADLPYDSPVIPDPLTRRLCPAGVRNPDQRERRRARPWHPLG